ncbi:hypothetical protein MASR2M15_06130 [Anaerolineales bacterium]
MVIKKDPLSQIEKALEELRSNQAEFSIESYSEIMSILLEKRRQVEQLTRLSAFRDNDEIRLVTVLFVDIVDSTQLSVNLGAGNWKEVIGRWHSRLAEVVLGHQGEIGQYLGDGLLAFFGAQHSRSNDASRAVDSALDICQEVIHFSEGIRQTYHRDFAIRVSIATGRVAVGLIGNEQKQELLALGPATNRAAKLQEHTPPNQVLIDQDTFRLINNQYVIQQLQALKIKGFEQPVENYLVTGRIQLLTNSFTQHTIAGIAVPFVGRKVVFNQLVQSWEHLYDSAQLTLVTLKGDIGIGKSRCLLELSDYFNTQGQTTFFMVADYEKRTTSYNLLQNFFQGQCQFTDDMPQDEIEIRIQEFIGRWDKSPNKDIASILGYLAGYGFENEPIIKTLTGTNNFKLTAALQMVVQWFKAIIKKQPLVMMIDNAQWIDSASQQFLVYLLEHLNDLPILLIIAGREIPELLMKPDDLPSHIQISLSEINETATTQLIKAVLQDVNRLPDTLIPLIQTRAQGNPLFITQFLAMLFDNRVFIPQMDGVFKFDPIAYSKTISTLPSGLLGMIQARLDDLPQQARHILQIASVVGVTFWASIIDQLSEIEIDDYIDLMVHRAIVIKSSQSSLEGESQYQFVHTLYRDVAYEMLPQAKQQYYHQQIAQWLIEHIPNRPEMLPQLAEHFAKGKLYDLSLYIYQEAIVNRVQRHLMRESLTLIEKGLAISRHIEREIALPVVALFWMYQGLALYNLERYEESCAASSTALRLFGELAPDQMREARINTYRVLGLSYRSVGQFENAEQALKQGLELLHENDQLFHADLYRTYGSLYFYQGLCDKAMLYEQQSIKNYEGTASSQYSGAMIYMGHASFERGNYLQALKIYETVLGVNKQRYNPRYQVSDLKMIGLTHRCLFNKEGAFAYLQQAKELAKSIDQEDPFLDIAIGLLLVDLGQDEIGIQSIQQALHTPLPDFYTRHLVQLLHIEALYYAGMYHAAVQEAEHLLPLVKAFNPILHGRSLLWLGKSQLALNEGTPQTYLRDALQLEQRYGGRELWQCYLAMGDCYANEDLEVAEHYYERTRDVFQATYMSLHTRPDSQTIFWKYGQRILQQRSFIQPNL